jgi:hypothetical protein
MTQLREPMGGASKGRHMRNIVKRFVICFAAFAVIFCTSIASAQPPDPIVGTWKLNLERSKYPIPAPKSMTIIIAPAASGWTLTVDAIGADGQPQRWGYTSRFDGSESPVSGNPSIDTAVFKSTETGGIVQYKKNGSIVSTTSSAISDDGKTMTVTVKVPAAQGKEIVIVSVYDRL